MLPEVVFALGLLVLFSKLHIAYGVGAIVLGHVVFLSAYATIIIQARLASLSGSPGGGRRRPGRQPLARVQARDLPAAVAGDPRGRATGISFSFDDVIVSQFLGGDNAEPVSVLLFGMIHLHVTPEVNAIGTALMLITLITFPSPA